MGWTVYVKLTRGRVLTAGERDALIALVAAHNREPWSHEPFDLLLPPPRRKAAALAYGAIKLPREPEHPDIERLLEALTALRGAVEGATCEVDDDDGLVVWTEGGYALAAVGAQPEVTAPDTAGWQRASALATGSRRKQVEAVPSTPLEAAITALAGVPRRGFATDTTEKRASAAVERVAGDPGLREPLLAAWRQSPAAHGRMVSLRWMVKPVVPTPWFHDELVASIARAGQAGEAHRAYFAADLLVDRRHPAGLREVMRVLRRHRRDPGAFAVEPPDEDDRSEPVAQHLMWLPHLWRGELPPVARAGAVAGCVLALAAPGSTAFVPRAIMKLGGAALLPLVARIPADHPHAIGVAHQAASVAEADPTAFDAAAALCLRLVFHPFVQVRIEAARALRCLRGAQAQPLLDRAVALARAEGLDDRVFSVGDLDGRPAGVDPALADAIARDLPLADPIDDLVSRDRWHRAQGVTRYVRHRARRGGPLLPLLLFEEVNELVPPHQRATSVSWRDCPSLPPELQRRAAAAERGAFIRAAATLDDHAALPPRLREVERLGAAAVAAHLAAPIPPVIELSAAERADVEAAERAWLGDAD